MKTKTTYAFLVFGNIALLLLCLLPHAAEAQKKQDVGPYEVWIRNEKKHTVTHGYLQNLSDSTLTMIPIWHQKNKSTKVFPIEHVKWVQVRKRGNLGKGIVWGAAIGLVTGIAIGFLDGSDPPCEQNSFFCFRLEAHEKAVIYGMLTVPAGMIIGGVIGGVKTKFTIKGSRSDYARQREQLEKYRYGY